MKAIASRDEIALQLHLLLLMDKVDVRLRRSYIRQLDVRDIEKNVSTLLEARCDKILNDFMLRVNRDGAPVGQFI